MKTNFKAVAEEILGRTISTEEGIEISKIEAQEKNIEISIPSSLKEFYATLGNIPLFVDGYQHFATIEKLFVKDDKLVFLEEHQSVVYWAVDLKNDFTILQTTNQDFTKDIEWFEMDFELDTFLLMNLFFQCVMSDESYHIKAKGGFEYAASLDSEEYNRNKVSKNFIDTLSIHWEEVINQDNMTIYWNKKLNEESIIMYFSNSENKELEITACTKSEHFLDKLIDDYGFYQL
ncbi:hypothetical protein V9L05_19310 [Bernardetia sp. Wsw4-3y2]|uniref:hypothetical protein n=1 Tax=Bernardetia sp. Wsw4-3y2 TaxID=3127471 RepID=UPI0030CECF80